jgi:hypothetical protein
MSDANTKAIPTLHFNNIEAHSEDSDDSELIVLTNAAVFLHENSNRIETELQCLEEQVQKLLELDGILENVKRELHQLAMINRYSDIMKADFIREQPSPLDQSITVSYSSDNAVWDDRNSVTTVAQNY